jgi:phage terminase large subunit-like protein
MTDEDPHSLRGMLTRLLRLSADGPGDGLPWLLNRLPEPVMRGLLADFFGWQDHGGQREPAGDWRTWLLMAGRGFGKTRVGAEWVLARARDCPGARIALVAASRDEAARVMVEGESGLLAVAQAEEEMLWVPTRGQVTFASGAEAFVYSGAAADQLRGPQHHFAWCDELAKWRQAEAAWDNLMMGLRLGARPRALVTTTPRSGAILRRVKAQAGTVETGGRTAENAHLAEGVRDWLEAAYGGTRLGRQELDGVLFDAPAGALFPRELIERCRMGTVAGDRPLRRIVVGVDPPVSADGDACGILVCGQDQALRLYVLADASVSGLSPEGWARKVAAAADAWGADRVVAEKNQGGDMVGSVLRAVDAGLPVRLVSASRGKAARAEPVAARFEAGAAFFAGRFPELEDELAGLIIGGGYEPGSRSGPGGPGRSPDRADAMVWAMTELLGTQAAPSVRRL